ncbi:hypothetical protein GCM10020220_038110 [Nonomuraea rubra]|uniref:pyridoxal-phosphate dependent enzyme n=1 Tax=Nonomuraea rubra TaxID=46180 RepID=UPI0031EA28F0
MLLKREDAQVCRSYKVRGAFNLIASLTQDERRRGVVCASAGNHGQGVAFACARLGISGRVYVPSTTPRQKRERIAALGGDRVEIVVGGGTYDEASGAAHDDSERTGAVYVHPFDDVRTMAGQGTVGLEILEQSGELPGTVVVPVGGGGLISGLAVWLREHSPATRIVGAEPAGAGQHACRARPRRPARAARARHVRRRRRRRPGRRGHVPPGQGAGRRGRGGR